MGLKKTPLIPAQAGIQSYRLDARFRGHERAVPQSAASAAFSVALGRIAAEVLAASVR
jgi:hypothetical protein